MKDWPDQELVDRISAAICEAIGQVEMPSEPADLGVHADLFAATALRCIKDGDRLGQGLIAKKAD